MSLQTGDAVRITTFATYEEQSVLNVFFYLIEVLVVGVELIDLLGEFRDSVRSFMLGIQNTGMQHNTIKGENVTNGLDVEVLVSSIAGTDSAGEQVNPFTAAGFDLFVADRTTRKGSKRFAGVSEGRMNGNLYIGPDPETDDLSDALAAILIASGVPTGSARMTPVVVGRDATGALDLSRIADVVNALVRTNVTSQVSRKAR